MQFTRHTFLKLTFLLFLALFADTHADAQITSDSLSQELTQIMEGSGLPGCAIALVDGEKVLYQEAFGYADVNKQVEFRTTTLLNIGSVSKLFVGLAAVNAIKAGLITMDTEINDVMPFEITNPYHPEVPILFRHLLDHTSSIQDSKSYGKSYLSTEDDEAEEGVHLGYKSFLDSHEEKGMPQFISDILNTNGDWYKKKNFLKSAPGEQQAYANLNAALAAYVVESVMQKPFDELTEDSIFNELGMGDTYWQLDQSPADDFAVRYFPSGYLVPDYRLITYPDGGLVSNVQDLSLFLKSMIKSFSGGSNYLPAPFNQMLFPGDNDNQRAFWGMGKISMNIGHAGSDPGVQADVQFNAKSRIGRVILCNVNAEDNAELWSHYRAIHTLLAEYEQELLKTIK